ncbi:MAG TPA: hypothetical protein VHB98_16320, partial [Chloroflexota bacterium]|nr:hypothetical protein [Chloroflexota bacterium]
VTVHALAFAPHSAGVAYAATDDGIYQSVDDGNIWLPERRGIPDNTTMESIAVDPQHGATVVAGTSDGAFYRSTDGGTGWQYIDSTLSGAAVRSLIFDPAHPGSAYAGIGDSGGFYSSADAGVNWFPADTLPASPVLSLTLLSRPSLPTAAVPPVPNLPSRHYFPQSHHIVGGAFLYFFNKYGGVAVFGLPITEPFLENGQLVQYFERMRLVQTRTVVAVSALGTQVTAGRYFSPVTPFANRGSRRYFPATGHSLSGRFLIYWRSHHGALLFGAPISEPLYEQNGDGTGRTYLVQYFQNARMEYHPELSGSSYAVSLGLLGQQLLKQRGWL